MARDHEAAKRSFSRQKRARRCAAKRRQTSTTCAPWSSWRCAIASFFRTEPRPMACGTWTCSLPSSAPSVDGLPHPLLGNLDGVNAFAGCHGLTLGIGVEEPNVGNAHVTPDAYHHRFRDQRV